MITTAITDVNNEYDLDIIKTAAKEGIGFYRINWFEYHADKSLQESIQVYQQKIKALAEQVGNTISSAAIKTMPEQVLDLLLGNRATACNRGPCLFWHPI